MENGQKRVISWGRPGALVMFLICITTIGVASANHWRALDVALSLIWLGFLVIGSFVVLWRAWRHRSEPGQVKLGQLAALPGSWQRWVLGESKDDDSQ